MKYNTNILVSLAALSLPVSHAWFRMGCNNTLVTERIDPIIAPGKVSAHVHQVAGGNGLGFDESFEDARAATCSSCPIKEDLSNYWTPVLYYTNQADGSYVRVNQSNGMTVYYQQRGPEPIQAFPPKFRMVAGNPFVRNFTGELAAKAVSYVCLDYDSTPATQYPEGHKLPTVPCKDGVRAQVYFPACWNGKNDSVDYTPNMHYPNSTVPDNGPCPDTHPIRFISIFFEVIFDTYNYPWWNGNFGTQQPFVFSYGDATGYGFHGDFINGWDVPVLQKVADECTNNSGDMTDCHAFTINTDSQEYCAVPPSVDEDINGPFKELPGCISVTGEGSPAAPVTGCAVPSNSEFLINYTDQLSSGWAYQGCAWDDISSRSLSKNILSEPQMTVELCLKGCAAQGYTYAGLEFGSQCYCGNSFPSDKLPVAHDGSFSRCDMPCSGNNTQWCGGKSAMNLYKTCTGSSCENWTYSAIGRLLGGSGNGTSPVKPVVRIQAVESSGSSISSQGSPSSTGSASNGVNLPTKTASGNQNMIGTASLVPASDVYHLMGSSAIPHITLAAGTMPNKSKSRKCSVAIITDS